MSAAEPKLEACKLCTRCEGRGPLTNSPETLEKEEADEVADWIERLVQERRTGRRLSPKKVGPLAWELLLVWDEAEAQYQRLHQARIESLFEAIIARGM